MLTSFGIVGIRRCFHAISARLFKYLTPGISYLVHCLEIRIADRHSAFGILWIRVHFMKTFHKESEAENTTFLGVELFTSGDCHLLAPPSPPPRPAPQRPRPTPPRPPHFFSWGEILWNLIFIFNHFWPNVSKLMSFSSKKSKSSQKEILTLFSQI